MQKGCPAGSANTYSGSAGSVGPVEQQLRAEGERPVALHGELVDVRDREVEVELLGDL